jgi:sodium/potassium-transporting ATPase subunit beta
VAIAGAVLLVLLLLIVAIVVILTSDGWEEDKTWRYIRIIPKPNGPQNLITFRHGHLPFEGKVWPDLVDQLRELVANYDPLLSRNATTCGPTTTPPPNTVCLFNIRNIDPDCLKDNFGYDAGTPCIFIQFNNISDWVPEPYTATDYESNTELPKGMIVTQRIPSVYLECAGNTPVDQESMGQVDYTPMQGFPSQYFPYSGQPNYMPPLVAIKFKSPKTSIAIGITCKLWAKNLEYSEDSEPKATLPFNLLIE